MFDTIFGWRKASKCKNLIKKVRCRLKLLKNKIFTILRLLKEDIAQLLKNGYEQIALNRLDQLYVDENMVALYELLDQFSKFILLNYSYIRRHKDLPNDLNEAVSTLIFASARCGDVPELRHVRKLFRDRYGPKLTTSAVELHPGNLVNLQVKEKLIPQSIPEFEKNRLLDEIVRSFFFKPEVLALEYKPYFQAQPVTESYVVEQKEHSSPVTDCSIMLPSPHLIPLQEVQTIAILNTCYEYETGAIELRKPNYSDKASSSSERLVQYSEDSIIYLDDVQEFKLPMKDGIHCIDQDQRLFMFSFPSLYDNVMSYSGTRSKDGDMFTSETMMRSVSRKIKAIDDLPCEIYYDDKRSDCEWKYQKIVQFEEKERNNDDCEVILWSEKQGLGNALDYQVQGEEIEELECGSLVLAPYVGVSTMPQRHDIELKSTEICQSISQTAEEFNGRRTSTSPSHVHPKLPDYDDIAAKFGALKNAHQQYKSTIS